MPTRISHNGMVTLECSTPDCKTSVTFEAGNPALRVQRTMLLGWAIEANPNDSTENLTPCPICLDQARRGAEIKGT